jgi:hypothetical protein
MKDRRGITFLIFTILVLVALALAKGQGQSPASSRAQTAKDFDYVPVADYDNSTLTEMNVDDPEARALREAKGKRHQTGFKGFIKDRDTGGFPILGFRYTAPLPALPVSSDVVALGEVVDAHAYLSNDKTGVYSEFTIRVDEVFRDRGLRPVVPGSLIVAERTGGRVRFPSGRVLLYGNRGEGMPRQGRRYLFFLKGNDQQYAILTAYELRSGRVYPLDGKDAPGGEGGDWAGDVYQGADVTQFLREVQMAIAQAAQ